MYFVYCMPINTNLDFLFVAFYVLKCLLLKSYADSGLRQEWNNWEDQAQWDAPEPTFRSSTEFGASTWESTGEKTF